MMKKPGMYAATAAILVGLGIVGIVAQTSGTDGEGRSSESTPKGSEPSSASLEFPPPTTHSHTYELFGVHSTEVEEAFDEFTDESTTSVEIRGFAGEFFSLHLAARQIGANRATAPESVSFTLTTNSVYGPPLEGASELLILIDGGRLRIRNVERDDSTGPSSESLAAQATELRRMAEHLQTLKQEGRELAAGRMPAGGLSHRDADDFKVEVLHETDYWVELSWTIPIADFLRIANADSVRGRVATREFTVGTEELNVLRDFASRLAPRQ